jgi:hypothetical protein
MCKEPFGSQFACGFFMINKVSALIIVTG